jgi:hypothetical protein
MDSRRCFLVKLAHEAEAADDSGDADDPEDSHPRFTRSKLAKWVKANGQAKTINSADGKNYRTWALGLITKKFWVIHPADQDIFGVWQ